MRDIHKAVPVCLTSSLLPEAQTLLCLSHLIIAHKCEAVRRGITETWDCKRAAELLHMTVPVSMRAEPRHWACALLCIASHGWQRNHNLDGWIRYAGYALFSFSYYNMFSHTHYSCKVFFV